MKARLMKEIRILFPYWVAALGVLIGTTWYAQHHRDAELYSFMVYYGGCVLLGVVSFGAELHSRMLPFCLTQPVSRRRMWNEKTLVLSLALWSLALANMWGWPYNVVHTKGLVILPLLPILAAGCLAGIPLIGGLVHSHFKPTSLAIRMSAIITLGLGLAVMGLVWRYGLSREGGDPQNSTDGGDLLVMFIFFMMPIFCALGAGPFLVLWLRNSLVALVCTGGFPLLILVAFGVVCEPYFMSHYGVYRIGEMLACLGGLAMIYAVVMYHLGWARFLRYQAVEAPLRGLYLPRTLHDMVVGISTSMVRNRGHAGLIAKELRLQGISFMLTGILLVYSGALFTWSWLDVYMETRPNAAEYFQIPFFAFVASMPVLIGALTTAEERQLGMVEWQLTLPMSVRRQWWNKVGIAFGLYLVLGLVVPWLVLQIAHAAYSPAAGIEISFGNLAQLILVQLFALSLALYASSFAGNTFKAAVMGTALFSLFAVIILVWRDARFLYHIEHSWLYSMLSRFMPQSMSVSDPYKTTLIASLSVFAVVANLVLILVLAFINYREIRMRPARVAIHVLIMLLFMQIVIFALVNLDRALSQIA